jgi:hypothetical protein
LNLKVEGVRGVWTGFKWLKIGSSNEPSRYIKVAELFEWLSDCQLRQKSATWN